VPSRAGGTASVSLRSSSGILSRSALALRTSCCLSVLMGKSAGACGSQVFTSVKDYHRDDVASSLCCPICGRSAQSIALAHIDSAWTYLAMKITADC